MAPLDDAHTKLKAAEEQAAEIVRAARLEFGRVIRRQREAGVSQANIARRYGLERETIRRYQEAAEIADGLKSPKS